MVIDFDSFFRKYQNGACRFTRCDAKKLIRSRNLFSEGVNSHGTYERFLDFSQGKNTVEMITTHSKRQHNNANIKIEMACEWGFL